MWDITYCNPLGDFLLWDHVVNHSKPWIWNGNDSPNIIYVHEYGALSFKFVIHCWCCWVPTHYLWKSRSQVGVGFDVTWICEWVIGSVAIVESIRRGDMASFCCNWNLAYLRATISPLRDYFPSSPATYQYHRLVQIIFLFPTTHTTLDIDKADWTHVPHCWWIRSLFSTLFVLVQGCHVF